MLRNLYWLVMGISVPFSIRRGWLSILWIWQKCTHLVSLLEILKPFFKVHFGILLTYGSHIFCTCNKWESYRHNDPLISGGRQTVISLILIMNRITDSLLPWGIVAIFLVLDRRVYCLFMFRRSSLLGSVLWRWGVCLWLCYIAMMCQTYFKIKKDWNQMFIFNECFSD